MPKVFDQLTEMLEEITSLEVATLTSTKSISLLPEPNADGKQAGLGDIDPKETFKLIKNKLGSSPDVALVSYSKFDLDGDALSFISNDTEAQPLVESHGKLVESAQKSRIETFNFVKKVLLKQ